MSADDSIPNADAMQTLIRLIGETSTPLGATEQELLRTTLMATAEKPLLESFSHSPALIKVAEWLAASLQQDVTLAWLALLGHMPMTIKALTDSGVGKVVNKLRKSAEKSEDKAIIAETKGLLERWKALTTAAIAAPAVAAPAVAAPAKRTRPEAVEVSAKRPATSISSMEDDSSLDSALSAAVPRKASLKPDHMKPRRPIQPVVVVPPPRAAPTPPAPTPPASHPTIIVPPGGGGGDKPSSPVARVRAAAAAAAAADAAAAAAASTATSPPATDGKPARKRVAWLSDDKGGVLCETKEYVVEAKEKPQSGNQVELDLQARWARELQGEKAALQRHRNGSADLDVQQLPWGLGAGETSPRGEGSRGAGFAGGGGGPQPTLQWHTPPLLDQSLWPEAKGDLSTERDTQRQRRAMVPEAPLTLTRTATLTRTPTRTRAQTP